MPRGSNRYDACDVCAGDGSSCRDCRGVPNGTSRYDACDVCDGNGQSCRDCAGVVGGTFLGIFLLGGLFISLGCLASALTRNQVIAAMVTLAFGVSMFLLSVLVDQLPVIVPWQAQVLASFALFQQMHDYSRGVVDTRSVVFFVSLTLFFLFLTLRVVESRRWK